MTPRDESDVFRRVELGIPGVSVHYGSGASFAELVVVPLAFTPSRLPQGRWNIDQSIALGGSFVERQDLPMSLCRHFRDFACCRGVPVMLDTRWSRRKPHRRLIARGTVEYCCRI